MVRLKLSQLPEFAPAHLGESNRSGLAGMIAPVQVAFGLDSETVAPVGLAPYEVGMTNTERTTNAAQRAATTVTLTFVLESEFRKCPYIEVLLKTDGRPALPLKTGNENVREGS